MAKENQTGILQSIRRVIRRSDCSAGEFYWGLCLRVLERCFEILPLLVCYFWLINVLNGNAVADGQTVWGIAGLLLAIFMGQLLCSWRGQHHSFMGSYHIMQSYRARLIDRVRQLPLGQLYHYRTGQLADILTDDIKRVEGIFTHVAADVFAAGVTPVLWFVVLLYLDWQLATALIVGLPFACWILNAAKRFFERVGQQRQTRFQETAGVVVEFVSGIRTLRLFNRTGIWLSRLNQQFDLLRQSSVRVETWGAGPVVVYRLMLELGLVALLLVCASQMLPSQSTATVMASWLLFLLLAHKLLEPLLEMSGYLTILRHALQSEVKIETLFSTTQLSEPAVPVTPSHFAIRFDHVCFSYDQQSSLQDICFSVPQNSITAIVGPSGAGKSTVLNLLARFYDPQSGSVTIGDEDLRAIGTDGVYQHISTVFQHVQLFDGSIRENIRIGRPDASDAQIMAACQSASCHDFIMGLPEQYETRVGEGGMRLSGGERQRLSIARALLKDAPVLLLDEATAAVDASAQHAIQNALNRLVVGRVVIMVAHRLSTVRNADQILVMDKGRIVEQGNHQSLLQRQGLYYQLWQSQSADK
ncbi:HlyB/MsbA family ABC transporter [Methylophaga frappieri]|uniref:HlyB/MsbA family ABC transporter n=1 Tax=Methylophaga frappieri (strain ATCC BAA-2434 / DSM 25690 / JAM7) TaxID=754477 RepID=I1YF64_METFJ|nr:ABC transporter ATP-binding protein [Methylophaga frappieri]AFJ01557.1 HlyB/MsbA family ABC transporter [Methylophaga frappieri]